MPSDGVELFVVGTGAEPTAAPGAEPTAAPVAEPPAFLLLASVVLEMGAACARSLFLGGPVSASEQECEQGESSDIAASGKRCIRVSLLAGTFPGTCACLRGWSGPLCIGLLSQGVRECF